MATNLISRITVFGNATATTYQQEVTVSPGPPPVTEMQTFNDITADTNNLVPGMKIIFLNSIGGLVVEQEYYILSNGFSPTNMRVGLTNDGSAVTLITESKTVPFIASRATGGTGPGILANTNTSNPPQVDYTDSYSKIAEVLTTLSNTMSSIETSAKTDGIKTLGVYDWVLLSSVFKMYVDDITKENFIGRDKLEEYRDKINSLPKS